jgi:hypothetical protein
MTVGFSMAAADPDFGRTVEGLLSTFSATLFGVQEPLPVSALGLFTDTDNSGAVAKGSVVSTISSATDPEAEQIALWPDDVHPTHLFVCVENSFDGDSSPEVVSVQRVDLNGDSDSNAQTIVKGLSA